MELEELRKIAEAAQGILPEPWIVMDAPESLHVAVVEQSKHDGSIISGGTVAEAGHVAFRDHIATFDPPTVLALITHLEQAEQDRVKLRNRLDAMRRQRDGYRNQLRKTESTKEETMSNQPPLNPDAIKAARIVYGGLTECEAASDCDECQVEAGEIIRAYLAVAQPEVNTFEESDALPVGSVVLDVDGNTARRFPGGWRTTVVEADGSVWLSGNMEDPDLPARVLYRPVVES